MGEYALPELPGARRGLTQFCTYSFPLIFYRGREYVQKRINSQNTPGTPGTYGNGGLTVTEFERLSCWLRELAECRSVRARRVVAKWLIRRELPRVLGLPVPPLEVPKIPRNPLPPKDFSAEAGGGWADCANSLATDAQNLRSTQNLRYLQNFGKL